MTTISSTQKFATTGIFSFISNIEQFFADRAVYKTTVTELNRLSERELNDLGLCRADITKVARDAVAMR